MNKVPLTKLAPEAVVDGIITFDGAGMIITTDPEIKKIFADTGDELVGLNVCSLMTDPFCDEFMDDLIHYSVNGG